MTESTTSTVSEQAQALGQTPGAMLRDARERSGQTHAAVGEALHLTVHYIKALENDDYNKLPGLIFVKGYIRSYGQYLKLDVDALIRSYDAHVATLDDVNDRQGSYMNERRNQHRRRSDQSLGWALVAGLIVVIALGAGWWFVGRSGAVSSNAAAAAPAASTASAPAARNTAQPAGAASTNATMSANNGTGAAQPASTLNSTSQSASSTGLNALSSTGDAAGADSPAIESALDSTLPTADVTSAATAIAPSGEVIESSPEASGVMYTTVTEDGLTVIPAADGSRQVSMFGGGSDELQLHFSGDSWVEIDDGDEVRLYSNMLNSGDTLTIQGNAPFQLLLGNARNVQVSFNHSVVDIASSIREDNTARVQLANPVTSAPVAGAGVAQ